MNNILFLTPPDAHYGFLLSGARQIIVEPGHLPQALNNLLESAEKQLLIIDERLLANVEESKILDLEKRWPGAVIVLPAPMKAELPEEDYALQMIARAIGYHVRIAP